MNLALGSPLLRRVGVVAVAAILIAGCSSTGSSASPTAAATAPAESTAPAASGAASPSAAAAASFAPISMTVVEDYPAPHWIAQVPWWMAKEKGFYSDLGLDVNVPAAADATGPCQVHRDGQGRHGDQLHARPPDRRLARSRLRRGWVADGPQHRGDHVLERLRRDHPEGS